MWKYTRNCRVSFQFTINFDNKYNKRHASVKPFHWHKFTKWCTNVNLLVKNLCTFENSIPSLRGWRENRELYIDKKFTPQLLFLILHSINNTDSIHKDLLVRSYSHWYEVMIFCTLVNTASDMRKSMNNELLYNWKFFEISSIGRQFLL